MPPGPKSGARDSPLLRQKALRSMLVATGPQDSMTDRSTAIGHLARFSLQSELLAYLERGHRNSYPHAPP